MISRGWVMIDANIVWQWSWLTTGWHGNLIESWYVAYARIHSRTKATSQKNEAMVNFDLFTWHAWSRVDRKTPFTRNRRKEQCSQAKLSAESRLWLTNSAAGVSITLCNFDWRYSSRRLNKRWLEAKLPQCVNTKWSNSSASTMVCKE